jgi:hypothetical protein
MVSSRCPRRTRRCVRVLRMHILAWFLVTYLIGQRGVGATSIASNSSSETNATQGDTNNTTWSNPSPTVLPDCNPRGFDIKLFSYSHTTHVEGPLPPRRLLQRLKTSKTSRSHRGLSPQMTSFVVGKSSMFYIDNCPHNGNRTCVHALDMYQQGAELFATNIAVGSSYCDLEMPNPTPMPGFEGEIR